MSVSGENSSISSIEIEIECSNNNFHRNKNSVESIDVKEECNSSGSVEVTHFLLF